MATYKGSLDVPGYFGVEGAGYNGHDEEPPPDCDNCGLAYYLDDCDLCERVLEAMERAYDNEGE